MVNRFALMIAMVAFCGHSAAVEPVRMQAQITLSDGTSLWDPVNRDPVPEGGHSMGRQPSVVSIGACPMHRSESPEQILSMIASAKARHRGTALAIDLCLFRQEEGLRLFGKAVDAVRIDPFASQNANEMREWRGPSAILSRSTRALGPGRTIARIKFDPQQTDLIWVRTILALAHGCRVIHFDIPPADNSAARARLILMDQLRELRPSLSYWNESAPIGEVDTEVYQVGAWLVRLTAHQLALVVVRGDTAKEFTGAIRFSCPMPAGTKLLSAVDLKETIVVKNDDPASAITIDKSDIGDGFIWYLNVQ